MCDPDKCPMNILCISCFCQFYMYTFWTYICTHITHGDGFYGVLVYMYLQTNYGVAGLGILYSTSLWQLFTHNYKYYNWQ